MSSANDVNDALIERAIRGEATSDELERIEAWFAADPAHRERYRRIERLVEAGRELGERLEAVESPGAAALLAADRPPDRKAPHRWLPWGVAATAVLALVGSLTLLDGDDAGIPDEPLSVTTAESESATVELEDGTVVRLGANSRLDVVRSTGARETRLEGRAFFDVAARPDVPFHVRSPVGDARVLGTRFELSVEDRQLRLFVVEGRVGLSAADGTESVEVGGGELSGVVDGAVLPPRRVVGPDSLPDWVGTMLVFRSTALSEAARELESAYGVRVTITDSTVARRTVTGTFVNRSAEDVMRALCSIVDASCRFSPEEIVVSG